MQAAAAAVVDHPPDPAAEILEIDGVSKTYPGVVALDGVSFSVRRGEVMALLGENGAGKSTLIKILSGAVRPDTGTIALDGAPIAPRTPHEAQLLGISTIFQEFNLVGQLSAAENIFLGRERVRSGFVRKSDMRREGERILARIGAAGIDLRRTARELSIAEQQLLEIAKAMAVDARLVIMDEPTATLSESEVGLLFTTIRRLTAAGVTVLYVSHRLEEVFTICNRATVLKDGRLVGTVEIADIKRAELVRMMVGRELTAMFPPRAGRQPGKALLEVEGLSTAGAVRDVSLRVCAGEIVGIAGLVGAGRTELVRALFGAEPVTAGKIRLAGQGYAPASVRDAIRAGVVLAPEDRKQQGLVLGLSVRENATLAILRRLVRAGFLRGRAERALVGDLVRRLRVAAASPEVAVGTLSGGNQQKVVLAKWLGADCRLLILDEPTRGVDVGAKVEIYALLDELARAGKAVLVVSSELPEVLGLCDRVLTMRAGRLTGELRGASATEEAAIELIAG